MSRFILLLLLAPLISACGHGGPGSVMGGECKIFEAPKYAVKGKTQYDQDWVDSTVEGGVGGCHWNRPAARPASLDVPRTSGVPRAKAKQVKRLWLFKWKVKDGAKVPISKIWPDKPTAPVEAIPLPPEPPAAPPMVQPAPRPPPRSPIDRLLHPKE